MNSHDVNRCGVSSGRYAAYGMTYESGGREPRFARECMKVNSSGDRAGVSWGARGDIGSDVVWFGVKYIGGLGKRR